MNFLARFLSVVLHPLLLPTYIMALLAFQLPAALFPISAESVPGFLMLIFIMTFALPVLNISFFRLFGTISSFSMEERRERVLPFAFITILYGVVTYLFYSKTRISLDDNLLRMLLIIDALVLIATVITLFYKVSVHALAACGMLGILLPLNRVAENGSLLLPTLIALILTGMVMSARLQLNAHTPREVWVGAVTGLGVACIGMLLLF